MKIIQSFAQFDAGNPYVNNESLNRNEVYLNFYTFLLSYLTLKKFYGSVTMFCNQKAYDTFIKYIPYDQIVIMENKNNIDRWNFYKIDAIRKMNEMFVHVDSDVFVFNDLFKPFIEKKFDGIVQDFLTPRSNKNFSLNFISNNRKILKNSGIFDSSIYDGRCVSCGVIGMTLETKNKYIELVDQLIDMTNKGLFNIDGVSISGVIEELGFYMTSLKYHLKLHDILPYSEIQMNKGNPTTIGSKYGYTHMWFKTKFVKKNVDLIKQKINKDFPSYAHLVKTYDETIKTIDIIYAQ